MSNATFFYGAVSNDYGNQHFSQRFYSSIEDAILNEDIEYGHILKYGYSFDSGDDLNIVPKLLKSFRVVNIENYELFEFLEDDDREMTPENYMVFNRSDEGHENMFTIVSLS